MKSLSTLLVILGIGTTLLAAEEEPSNDQLWIMIKTDTFFRTDKELIIVDDIEKIMVDKNLGSLDGHSSGAHQFEFNFYQVSSYLKAKVLIEKYFKTNYPHLVFVISKDYEKTYERL